MATRNHTGRELAPRPAQPRQLLDRILSDATLVNSVHVLEPRALARLIRHVGLEDAGELVSLATSEQLTAIFDDDLWASPAPGVDETFDPVRFALWLEVMIEAGEDFAARRLTELDEDLVSLALHRLVLVVDLDQLAVDMAERGEEDEAVLLEKALESCPYEELGRYRVIARRHDGWDAIVSLLVALDKEHHDFLERLLERLAYVSRESIEEGGGLYHVLTAQETLEVDAAAEREDRRGREGFVAPSAAASFLALAAATEMGDLLASAAEDPITRAYFRDYQPRPRPAASGREPRDAARLRNLLGDAGVLGSAIRPQLARGAADRPDRPTDEAPAESLLREALAGLAERDPAGHERQLGELNYLANVLIAGCPLEGRRFRPFEAAAAALATCNLGLERLLNEHTAAARTPGGDAEKDEPAGALLERVGAVLLFRAGWHVLQDDVALPARRAAVHVTRNLAPAARSALQALAGPCPLFAGILADPTETGSGAAGQGRVFIATVAQVRRAQSFLAEL